MSTYSAFKLARHLVRVSCELYSDDAQARGYLAYELKRLRRQCGARLARAVQLAIHREAMAEETVGVA